MADVASTAAVAPSTTAEPLDTLRVSWAALHTAVRQAPPFLHPAWAEVWLRHFGTPDLRPAFLAVREGEDLIGVAALSISSDAARQVGNHKICDYAGVLARPGSAPAVAAGVLHWLEKNLTPRLVLWGIQEDSPTREAFAEAAKSNGWSYEESDEAIAPRMYLPGDFESYVAELSKKDRHELRRKLRNLDAAASVAFDSVTGADAIDSRFDRFLELMRISRDDKDEFLTPAMEGFFRDLAHTLGELGLVRLSTLWLDGHSAAMIFCFENKSTTFLYNSGYDPAFAHLAVGLLSKAHAIRDCIGRGKTEFDFLRGDEEYKRRLGGLPKRVLTLRMRQD